MLSRKTLLTPPKIVEDTLLRSPYGAFAELIIHGPILNTLWDIGLGLAWYRALYAVSLICVSAKLGWPYR